MACVCRSEALLKSQLVRSFLERLDSHGGIAVSISLAHNAHPIL